MAPGVETRLKALDGLRGLAVLQVVVFHYYLLLPIEADWYQRLCRLGAVIDGLTLFFVLSGFLIAGMLLDKRDAPALFRVFYGRRACRILPLYILLLVTYGLVRLPDEFWRLGFLHYWYSEFPFWNYLVFLQNERMVRDGVLGAPWLAVTWSLAVEMQFYLIAPWVVRFVSTRSLILVAACCVAAGPFLHSGGREYLLRDRLDALAAGVLVAGLVRHRTGQAFFTRCRTMLQWLVGVYLVVLIALRTVGATHPVLDSTTTAAVVFAVGIALLADGTAWPVVKPAIELLAPVGLLSYFVYLFHMPVAFLFEAKLPTGSALALPVTFALAAVSYRYFEVPVIRWGQRISYGQPLPTGS